MCGSVQGLIKEEWSSKTSDGNRNKGKTIKKSREREKTKRVIVWWPCLLWLGYDKPLVNVLWTGDLIPRIASLKWRKSAKLSIANTNRFFNAWSSPCIYLSTIVHINTCTESRVRERERNDGEFCFYSCLFHLLFFYSCPYLLLYLFYF